jgi:hypothetical protein
LGKKRWKKYKILKKNFDETIAIQTPKEKKKYKKHLTGAGVNTR